jgi:hypothetical protein
MRVAMQGQKQIPPLRCGMTKQKSWERQGQGQRQPQVQRQPRPRSNGNGKVENKATAGPFDCAVRKSANSFAQDDNLG